MPVPCAARLARAALTACTALRLRTLAHRCQHTAQENMSRVEAAAATRDYALKPRLEYRTVAGVNGPLVILEVRSLRPIDWGRTGQTSELCVWAFWVSALSRVARGLQPC